MKDVVLRLCGVDYRRGPSPWPKGVGGPMAGLTSEEVDERRLLTEVEGAGDLLLNHLER